MSCAQEGPCAPADRQVTVSKGFYTGVELDALNDHDLAMFAAGYVDAVQAATMIGVTEPCRKALQTCVVGEAIPNLQRWFGSTCGNIRIVGRASVMLSFTMRYSVNALGNNRSGRLIIRTSESCEPLRKMQAHIRLGSDGSKRLSICGRYKGSFTPFRDAAFPPKVMQHHAQRHSHNEGDHTR